MRPRDAPTSALAALLVAATLAGALTGCSGKSGAPPEPPTPKVVRIGGASAEVSVLSTFDGTAQHPQLNIPGYTEPVLWVQVAFRYLTQAADPTLDRTWFRLQDADGQPDPRITHLGPDVQAFNPDPDRPVLDPVMSVAKDETVAGFLAFAPSELVFTPTTVVFHPPNGDQVSWPLAGLPTTPVPHPVQFPPTGVGAVPGQSSVVEGGEYTERGQRGEIVPAKLQVTMTDPRNRPDRISTMPQHRVVQFTVTVVNRGPQPVWVDPGTAVTAYDGEGHFYPPAGLGTDDLVAGPVEPGETRKGSVAIPVPEHAVLDHLRFALSQPGSAGITWWRLR